MYFRRIDNARKAVAFAFAIFGLGFVICLNLGYEGSLAKAFGIGICVCLMTTVALAIELLVRSWTGSPLTTYKLAIVSLLAVIVSVTAYPAFIAAHVLYHNVGLNSFGGILAIGVAVCLAAATALLTDYLVRSRRGHHVPMGRYELVVAGSLGFIACLAFVVLLLLRSDEAHNQHQAVRALEQMHCSVYYDYMVESEGHSAGKGGLSWVPHWLLSYVGKDFFHRIVRVDVENPNQNVDKILLHLQALTNLEYVVFLVEVPPEYGKQIKQALPSCKIRYPIFPGIESVPWSQKR